MRAEFTIRAEDDRVRIPQPELQIEEIKPETPEIRRREEEEGVLGSLVVENLKNGKIQWPVPGQKREPTFH